MPPSSQPDNTGQDASQVNDTEIQKRPLIGIPNSYDDYGHLSRFHDPTTGHPHESFQTYQYLPEHKVSHGPPSSFKRTSLDEQTRAPVPLEGPLPTAPGFVFDLSQASAGTLSPRQATHGSEATLGHAQNYTPTFVHTPSRGSGTTFVTPGSSPYLNAVDSGRFDVLAGMTLEAHSNSAYEAHEFGSTLDTQHPTVQQKLGYPSRVASPWNPSEVDELEPQIMLGSQRTQQSKDADVDNASTHTQGAISHKRGVSSLETSKRKREPLSSDSRNRAAKMRKRRVCLRCRLLHQHCGDGDPCPSCRDIQGTAIVWNMNCFRASVNEVQVYRTAAISFPDGLPKITQWVDKSNQVVRLYNIGLADAHPEPLERPIFTVRCCQYTDELPENYLKRCWTSDGGSKKILLPKYAIKNLQRTIISKKLDATLNTNYTKLLGELSFEQGEIVSTTLTAAASFSRNGEKRENRDMIHGALKIAIITRLISKSFNLTSSEPLGIPQDTDPTSPYYQRIPIPPILDYQIDRAWMDKMQELRKDVVCHLKKMIMKHERENWYTIFLTIMVLLSNLEFLYQHQHQQMLRHCGPDYNPSAMMESWQHSAKILITYFHAIFRGNLPIVMKWTKEDEEAAGLDEQARTYLAKLKGMVESQEKSLRELAKGEPYKPLVWLSTLLLENEGDSAPPRDKDVLER